MSTPPPSPFDLTSATVGPTGADSLVDRPLIGSAKPVPLADAGTVFETVLPGGFLLPDSVAPVVPALEPPGPPGLDVDRPDVDPLGPP